MKIPSDHPIEFTEWYKSTKPADRTLANAFQAGKLGQQMELYRPPEPPSKREWRPVHPSIAVRSTVRGLYHLGEVLPQITDGIKVIVCVIATGKKFPTFLDNLKVVQLHIADNNKTPPRPKSTGRPKSTRTKLIEELLADLLP